MYPKIILFILLPLFAFSQSPQKINFQSILRNTNGEVQSNKSVSLKISILSGSISGSSVYSETHTKTTDISGLISLQIGNGTVLSGVFGNIAWGSVAHFIKLEADFSGGSNYVLLGTQELMSVPYALYATKTDTSSLNLVNRLNAKVNISDTANMLSNYRTGINAKVNISDTSSMLNPYLRKSDAIVDDLHNQDKLLQSFSNVIDIDGNIYKTVKIGTQIWMSENLKTSRYRNGDPIPIVTDNTTWSGLTNGARCWYDNDSTLYEYSYGNLYNWYAASDNRNICPTGWHVPSDNEWTIMIDYLGGLSVAGGKMKVKGTTYWNSPNLGATNETGFTSLPGGYRKGWDGVYVDIKNSGYFWSSSEIDPFFNWNCYINYNSNSILRFSVVNSRDGFSIRCIKDPGIDINQSLNIKVNISDTSSMLNPYLRKADAIVSVETDPVFNASIAKGITGIDTAYWNRKLNIADTSSMLTNYRTGLNNKVNFTDTASMLANYRTGINTKVNIADTASMLNNYLRSGIAEATYQTKLTNPIVAADTASMLSNYRNGLNNKLNILDTTILSNRINTKLNISDFPLGTTPGNMQYWNGTTWVNLAPGLPGQVISMSSTGIPSWSGAAYATLTTNTVSSITPTSVNGGGNISADGGASVTAKGIVYGTSTNPTLSNSVLTIGSGTGSFSGSLTGLTPNTTYYIRAYATNTAGTNYGNEISFQTLPVAVPTLITTDASGITQTMVTTGGTISNDGGATITERGIVYGTSSNPTTSNTKVTSGSGTGSFSVNITALTPNTTYYIRSYAINSAGTGYGNNITFQTSVPSVPSLTTRELLNITNTTATGGGSITNDGGSSITAKGICWGTSPNPTTIDSKTTDGTGTTTFTSFITGLSASVTYYVRAYATNSTGTGYGNQQSFTTSSTSNTLPVVTSTSVTGLTTIQAIFNAEVNNQGGGTVTERGAVWNTSGNPTVNSNRISSGSGTGIYATTITGLSGGSNYYVRAYALNSYGISYGLEIPFSTLQGLPMVLISSVSVQTTGAVVEGNVTDAGGQSIIERGVVWNTTGTPTTLDNKIANGNSLGTYTTQISGLTLGSTYFIRTYATNTSGTAYSNTRTITTALPPVVDIDGNYYDTVHIGNQIWFKQNLKTTRYRNGGNIPYVLGNTDWQALTTGAWSYYAHDPANDAIYGKLYNWFTTQGDTICPTGWHVPSDSEWTILIDYLGGESVAGGKMKSIGTDYWYNPNTGATNVSGFSALPGGFRNYVGSFYNIRITAFFWSATSGGGIAGIRLLGNFSGIVERQDMNKLNGLSIRCLRD